MQAKLYKREDRYDLYSEDDHKIASSASNTFGKLSKQNCDEIFKVKQWDRTCLGCNKGFNFEQMISNHKCCPYCEGFIDAGVFFEQPIEIEVEIEMEKVVDETKIIGAIKGVKGSGDKITTYKTVPKLDSEGCLILKKI